MDNSGIYYFKSDQGWGAPGCKDAQHLFIVKHETPTSEAMLSLVLSSQAQNRTIYARGNCKDAAHFKVTQLYQGAK
ncbi:hypothetical protein [Vibrio hepatarius]|uniref:hypothetical protein n=1 Tax=Vibrio hepatarius TaxID=171383 RepID=UPI001C0990B9|nr:hypothetical protein [Vibrio hepatarius]MBU2898415.1 hypothetical protein [Vibrio hepatarius]